MIQFLISILSSILSIIVFSTPALIIALVLAIIFRPHLSTKKSIANQNIDPSAHSLKNSAYGCIIDTVLLFFFIVAQIQSWDKSDTYTLFTWAEWGELLALLIAIVLLICSIYSFARYLKSTPKPSRSNNLLLLTIFAITLLISTVLISIFIF